MCSHRSNRHAQPLTALTKRSIGTTRTGWQSSLPRIQCSKTLHLRRMENESREKPPWSNSGADGSPVINGQPSGLSASKMNTTQFDALMALMEEYARNVPDEADRRLAQIN